MCYTNHLSCEGELARAATANCPLYHIHSFVPEMMHIPLACKNKKGYCGMVMLHYKRCLLPLETLWHQGLMYDVRAEMYGLYARKTWHITVTRVMALCINAVYCMVHTQHIFDWNDWNVMYVAHSRIADTFQTFS